MPDIYSRNTDTFGGAFAADQAALTFPAITGPAGPEGAVAGLLVQNINVSYQQNVTRLFEVGSPQIYYVGGRTAGQGAMQRVIGPKEITKSFYHTYGNVCNARTNTIDVKLGVGCDVNRPVENVVNYTCKFVVITTIGLTISAADMLINESVQMMFSSFTYGSIGS